VGEWEQSIEKWLKTQGYDLPVKDFLKLYKKETTVSKKKEKSEKKEE